MSLQVSDHLKMPPDVARRVFAFLAMRGAGKTYCASVLAEEMMKLNIPIIVIDPMGVWWGLRVGKDGTGKGYPIVVFGGEHGDLPLEPEKAEKLAQALVQSNVSCVIDTSELSHAKVQEFVPRFLDELRRINTEDRHIFIEETDIIAPQKPMRNETVCLGAVDNFVRRGGNRNLGCTLITQRSAVVNKNVLTQSDFLVVLRTNAPQDKKAVSDWAVSRTAEKDKLNAWLDSLSTLKDGEAYVWGPDMNIPGVRIRFRERETFHATRENLKRFDASKIKAMNVDEFIARFRSAFEGKKHAPQEPRFALPKKVEPEVARIFREPAPLPEPRAAEQPKQEPAAISLEDVRLRIGITHSELLVPMSTREQKGQIIKVLMDAGNPITQAEVISRMAEYGWAIAQSVASTQISKLVKDGLLIREGRGLRLPKFVAFELNQR